MTDGTIRAVLGPTNTGKTHLAIERMCGHSSGAIGFPLRLLAREVYDRVVAIKGESQVALITGEERIEPNDARYFCCTAEAMPRDGGGHAFVALDEVQLAADRERGHIFTDRLLDARGREETMLLGSATVEPLLRELVPAASVEQRPRFSTLTHAGSAKLSRLPPRSAIVAFSAEQVYATAEMLRRMRGGAAVVMGALSPATRNRQVELFQSGEVDYIVATDAIGMGLNLDVRHVAFAGLTKFDGERQRRLAPAEMAQIAGRAGRHQTDGSFGTLAGVELTEEEIYAIEEHRFAPATRLYWRDAEPRFDSIATLVADLEAPPADPALAKPPEAIDLAVLKLMAEHSAARDVRGPGLVRRLWEACSLPDFRQHGAEMHARFVARLWQDLRGGYLGADYVAARIAELDTTQGDIDTLQGRIAAVRSWAYICQRPDWVLARDEMAARARGVEAKLSDALHQRLTERFVNRRTTTLLRSLGKADALPVALSDDDTVLAGEHAIGTLDGFAFRIDPATGHADRRLLLAAAEKALPALLAKRAAELVEAIQDADLELVHAAIWWRGQALAQVRLHQRTGKIVVEAATALRPVPPRARDALIVALTEWAEGHVRPLAPLARLMEARHDPKLSAPARALLHALVEGGGYVSRRSSAPGVLSKEARYGLRRLGIVFGALDIFVPALLKPGARRLAHAIEIDRREWEPAMPPVLPTAAAPKSGYRRAGERLVRIDMADRMVAAAHERRASAPQRRFTLDTAFVVSCGLDDAAHKALLAQAGFRLRPGETERRDSGPPRPDLWEYEHRRRGPSVRREGAHRARPAPAAGAFAELQELFA